MPTIKLLITGKVQGVFYRATAKEIADELKLTGWIKNAVNGNVEAVVTGSEQHLQQFTQWCKQGPRRAEVSHVIVTEMEEAMFDGFKIVR